ncbi:MAG: 30S ribosomal protein S5 [Candidatus Magasanikbacteria bacterium CG_4_10_14_0_2_um_filter_37_12]|uniref:Small ribosomal subunit protein uS5 n=1 Tax=Candidatus Magasanikbacteria bacterium CG_4_10_14_0_2_um_filter_37_12 TaxID=1974637 RepID=A0A2M7V8K9_9BACT|nr:MAG: 30S ribosomal protein S5 [Candidatus Magasanikbacteria bacterium CG_4_10_14_0_2_um_filter_37_12]
MEGQRNKKTRKPKEKSEFDQQIVDLARVTRVTKGGKQLSFRVCVLIGDRKGRVGYGIQKGKDVQIAVEKAVAQAKKKLIKVPLSGDTIPHMAEAKYKAAKVILKPAPQGTGVIAGSVIRTVLEMAGVPNASSKMLGRTNNKINNVKATFAAIEFLKTFKGRPNKNGSGKKSVENKDIKTVKEK